MNRIKNSQEWIKQAIYDIETAQVMLESRRYIYCIFMCHLAIEKALKAIYVKKFNKNSPKVHSLVYLAQNINLKLSQENKEFLERLDEISVPVRYPEELESLLKDYSEEKTKTIFVKTKETLEWLRKELEKH